MPKFGRSMSGRRCPSGGDELDFDPFTDLHSPSTRRPPQLQVDGDFRIAMSPLDQPRLGPGARRQLRAELFGPTQEPGLGQEGIYSTTNPVMPRGQESVVHRMQSLIPPKPSAPIDIHAAVVILKELKKTATASDLIALHRALLPEISVQQPQIEDFVQCPEPIPPQNAEMRRRRSLFRPGEATRTESQKASKLVSIPSPRTPIHLSKARASQDLTALTPPEMLRPRTATPSDLGRTYLGNYKLGSLIITNGAASPLPMSRLNHIRNHSNNTDEYYTASEGSVSNGNDVHHVRHKDGIVSSQDSYEPSVDLYENSLVTSDSSMCQNEGMLARQETIIRHDRPILDRRLTDDTIASTGSKYSCNMIGVMDSFLAGPVIFQNQCDDSDLHHSQSLQNNQGSTIWVEDVDPQFLYCDIPTREGQRTENYSERTTMRPDHHSTPQELSMTLSHTLVHLPIENAQQGPLRASNHDSESYMQSCLRSPSGDDLASVCEALPIKQGVQIISNSNSKQELHHDIASIDNLASANPRTTTSFRKRGAPPLSPPFHLEATSKQALGASPVQNGMQVMLPVAKRSEPLRDIHRSTGNPRKLQKMRPLSHNATSKSIIVQRQRSISDCPYLPTEIILDHSRRLDRSPGMDHLDRTYRSVAHSGSRDSLLSMEPFDRVEVRFPSPNPDSEPSARGRRSHRSDCGPFQAATTYFRSKSRKGIVANDRSDSAPGRAIPAEIRELISVVAPSDPSPYDVARSASGSRRVPSGPRAMMPSGQHPKRSPNGRPVQGMSEQDASQLALSRSRDRRLNHERKSSLPETAVNKGADEAKQATQASQPQNVDKFKVPVSRKPNTTSMLDRPRGSYYGDWIRSPKSLERNGQGQGHGSPSPCDRRKTTYPEGGLFPKCIDSGNVGKIISRDDAMMPLATFPQSPSRAPPEPPVLKLPKTRPTIRTVDQSPERLPHMDDLPKLCTPVRVSVSIIKPLSLPPSLPPTRAPPPPPKMKILSNGCEFDNDQHIDHRDSAIGEYGLELHNAWQRQWLEVDGGGDGDGGYH